MNPAKTSAIIILPTFIGSFGGIVLEELFQTNNYISLGIGIVISTLLAIILIPKMEDAKEVEDE